MIISGGQDLFGLPARRLRDAFRCSAPSYNQFAPDHPAS